MDWRKLCGEYIINDIRGLVLVSTIVWWCARVFIVRYHDQHAAKSHKVLDMELILLASGLYWPGSGKLWYIFVNSCTHLQNSGICCVWYSLNNNKYVFELQMNTCVILETFYWKRQMELNISKVFFFAKLQSIEWPCQYKSHLLIVYFDFSNELLTYHYFYCRIRKTTCICISRVGNKTGWVAKRNETTQHVKPDNNIQTMI